MRAYRAMSDYLLQEWARDTAQALMTRPGDRYLTRQLKRIGRVQEERRNILDRYAAKYNPNY